MADRTVLVTPGGVHVRVVADRVDRRKANGWTEVPAPKPAPRRTRKATTGDDE